jgi:hypothetical protein
VALMALLAVSYISAQRKGRLMFEKLMLAHCDALAGYELV